MTSIPDFILADNVATLFCSDGSNFVSFPLIEFYSSLNKQSVN